MQQATFVLNARILKRLNKLFITCLSGHFLLQNKKKLSAKERIIMGHSKMFAQDYRVLWGGGGGGGGGGALVRFRKPPPPSPPQSMFVLARTPPLPLNFYICEIYRKEINSEY